VEIVNAILRRSIAAAAVVLAAPVLSSCGFEPMTDRVYTPGTGVNERSGSVDVLGALVVSGADGSGTVVAGLVNNDEQRADALAGIKGAGPASTLQIQAPGPVEVPAGGFVQLADEGEVVIEGEDIVPGAFVELTFSFERGDSVTLNVPVVARRGDYADVPVPSVAPSEDATEDAEESAAH
jgi:hypothetical protein